MFYTVNYNFNNVYNNHVVALFNKLSIGYMLITLICKIVTGEYFQDLVIQSYQKHLRGNVLNIHIFSSAVMVLIFQLQSRPSTFLEKYVHMILGRIFMFNLLFILTPTSIYLTLHVVSSKHGGLIYDLFLKCLFFESSCGMFFATILAYYSIKYKKNVRFHWHFVKLTMSYASTPILDRLLLLFFKTIGMDYDTAHLLSLILLTMNMIFCGFAKNFIFISGTTQEEYPVLLKIAKFRWLIYIILLFLAR